MKGIVRHFLLATMAVFLITTGISFALVGDVDESDLYMQSDQGLSGTASENSVGRSASIEETGPVGAYIPYQGVHQPRRHTRKAMLKDLQSYRSLHPFLLLHRKDRYIKRHG